MTEVHSSVEQPPATGAQPIIAKAALLREVGEPLALEDVVLSAPGEGEIRVKMRGVGICHTDISAAGHGSIPLPLPAVLGHEGSGVVEAVGPGVEGLNVGDHVALSFDYCGECPQCEAHHPAYCELFAPLNYFGERLDGSVTMSRDGEDVHGNWFGQSSFATYAIASARNAVKVPEDLPLELLGPLGCGLQTGAGSVLNVLRAKAGESIAVFGLGGVGLGGIMAAKAIGCDPIVAIDLNPARLEIAKQLGATTTVNPSETGDLVWDILDVAAPGVHHSLDTVGIGPVVRQALEVLRTPGHCVTVGFHGLENEITIDQGHLLVGRRLSGVVEGDADPQTFIPELIRLYREGKFPFDRLVKTFPFTAINEAIEASESGAVIKPVVVFE
jgi:aryl-alcohol dehydrogenase